MAGPRLGFAVEVGGIADFFGDALDHLDREMDRAMDAAVDVVANEARLRAPSKTGELANSIGVAVGGSFRADTLTGVVSAGAPHALAVEDGTRPHVIRPRFRRALRFPSAGGRGGFAFAKKVHHPGTDPKPFLEPALESKADEIVGLFEDARDLAALKARR
jgi:hypothetical protein